MIFKKRKAPRLVGTKAKSSKQNTMLNFTPNQNKNQVVCGRCMKSVNKDSCVSVGAMDYCADCFVIAIYSNQEVTV